MFSTCQYQHLSLVHQRAEFLHVILLNASTIALIVAILTGQAACNLLFGNVHQRHLMTSCLSGS